MIRILNTIATTSNSAATVHKVWANTTPRNLLAAATERAAYQKDVVAANGNAAGSVTWVEVDGTAIDAFLLPADLSEARAALAAQ